MLLIKDKVAERLRKGTPFAEVRREFPSVSQLYAGARQYLDEADKEISVIQERFKKLRAAKIEEEDRHAELEVENAKLIEENMELTRKNMDLTQEVARKKEESRHLHAAVDRLRSQGYSPEIIEKIEKIEERSGPQLLSQVETIEKFNEIRKDFQRLKRKKRIAEGEFRETQTKRAEIEKAIISGSNRLDELRMETTVHKEGVEVVKAFKRDGYSVEDFRLVKSCLDNLQVENDPKLSISRLAKGLQMEKSLIILRDKVENERKNLRKYRKARADAENETEIMKKTTIDAIETTKNAGLEAIDKVAKNTNTAVLDAAIKFETRTDEHLKKCENHIERNMEKVNRELHLFSKFQKEKSKFEENILILTLLSSREPQILGRVPILFVKEMLDRILVWVLLKMPEAAVSPSPHVQRQNPSLFATPYKLSVLLELATEGLKQKMIEMTRPKKSER